MLEPKDYGYEAIKDPFTRKLMDKINFEHGGKEYDEKYPDGIPTSVVIKTKGKNLYKRALFSSFMNRRQDPRQ